MTHTPLTPQQLDEYAALDAAATPGPWHLTDADTIVAPLTAETIADVWEPTQASRNGEFIEAARTAVPALLADNHRLRTADAEAQAELAKLVRWHKEDGTALDEMRATITSLRARIAELEGPAVEARAALAALCYDLDDPGTAALGALYLLQQATITVDAPKDDTALALARHASEVLERAADAADPEPPEVSFFGDYGPQVAAWLRMLMARRTSAVEVVHVVADDSSNPAVPSAPVRP